MRVFRVLIPTLAALVAVPLHAQEDFKTTILKHLKTSRDFSLKVAEAMPPSDYDFKLTAAQMSFSEQMIHLSQGLTYFLSAFSGEKPEPVKPASKSKPDVVAYMKKAYDDAIAKVGALTPEQMAKTYKGEGTQSATGTDLLLGMLDHCTHHRASAEMYMRVKGIAPPKYDF